MTLRDADLEAICGIRGRHVAGVRAKQVITVRTSRHQRASLDAVADDESLFDELVRDLQNAQELSGKLLVGFSATSTIHTVHARRTVMIPSPGSPCEKSKLWSYDWVKIGTLWSLQGDRGQPHSRRKARDKKGTNAQAVLFVHGFEETGVLRVGDDEGVEGRAKERLEDTRIILLIQLDRQADRTDGLLLPTTLGGDRLYEARHPVAVGGVGVRLRALDVLDAHDVFALGLLGGADAFADRLVPLTLGTTGFVGVRLALTSVGDTLSELGNVVVRAGDVVPERFAFRFEVARQLPLFLGDLLIELVDCRLQPRERVVHGPLSILEGAEMSMIGFGNTREERGPPHFPLCGAVAIRLDDLLEFVDTRQALLDLVARFGFGLLKVGHARSELGESSLFPQERSSVSESPCRRESPR